MTPYFERAGVTLWHGSCLDVLRELAPESVQTVCTSPPYFGLRSYGTEPQVWGGDRECPHDWQADRYYVNGGSAAQDRGESFSEAGEANAERVKAARWREDATCRNCGAWCGSLGLEQTPAEYVEHLVSVFREVRRVLKPDGTLWMNLGDSYAGAGYSNHRGTGGAQREDGGKQHHTAAFRPGNPEKNGGISNRDGLGAVAGRKNKDLIGIPWLVAFALQADGWWLRSDVIWAKPNPMPDPANDRPSSAHEYVFLLSRSERYFYDADAVRQLNVSREQLRHTMRYAKTYPISDEHRATTGVPGAQNNRGLHSRPGKPGAALLDVWSVPLRSSQTDHSATYPPQLVAPCILAGSRPGDTVLDVFAGSGTTLAVASLLGRNAVGIELNERDVKGMALRLSQGAMALSEVSA